MRMQLPMSLSNAHKPSALKVRLFHCGWVAGFLLLGAGSLIASAASDEATFVPVSKPQLLSFSELVQVSQHATLDKPIADKMSRLLHTPFINNEAYLKGVKPIRPTSEELGPFVRTTF